MNGAEYLTVPCTFCNAPFFNSMTMQASSGASKGKAIPNWLAF